MEKKNKILIIVGGIWKPAVEMAGTKGIYEFIKKIAAENNNEIHLLTSTSSWTEKNINKWFKEEGKKNNIIFHHIKSSYFERCPLINLFLTRAHLFLKTIMLRIVNGKFHIIHEYISTPILMRLAIIYNKFLCKFVFYTFSTSNKFSSYEKKLGIEKNYIDKIFFLSKSQMESFSKNNKNILHKIIFLPIGVNVKKIDSYSKNNKLRENLLKEKTKLILNVGPLEERKGIFTLARAYKKLNSMRNDLRFVFVSYGKTGVDPKHEKNKKIVSSIVKNNFVFLEGKQPIFELMKSSDIFVLPLDKMHGTLSQPLTLLEAMACECNCIVSNLKETTDLIKDNETGHTFSAKSAEDLANKIDLSTKNLEKTALGIKAREEIKNYFDMEKNVEKMIKIYNSI